MVDDIREIVGRKVDILRAAIMPPEIDTTTGTERTRLIASREAEKEASHAAGRAAAFEWLRTP